MAARQVLVQQQHFERILADRAANEQRQEAIKRAQEQAAAAEQAKQQAAHSAPSPDVVVSLSKDASQHFQDNSSGQSDTGAKPPAPHKGLNISV